MDRFVGGYVEYHIVEEEDAMRLFLSSLYNNNKLNKSFEKHINCYLHLRYMLISDNSQKLKPRLPRYWHRMMGRMNVIRRSPW